MMIWKKTTAAVLACLMAVGMFGCGKEEAPEVTGPSKEDKPMLEITEPTSQVVEEYTPVYAVAYGDTIYLAKVPMSAPEGEEAACEIREVSLGGRIHCGKEHEGEEKVITRVVITEEICPKSTADWFRDMTDLRSIEGLEKLRMDGVTDMSFMFSGCIRLTQLEADGWDVSKVEDMTGIFDGCDGLRTKPVWYTAPEGGLEDKLEEEDTFNGGAIH
ncbi:MAG: BspA family leucine-rich repeat surface protein [Oscillospiraceae bacterium]|nr:BspA family leucine-rich repeat surface protein [Oscillospiraceae bacterium]